MVGWAPLALADFLFRSVCARTPGHEVSSFACARGPLPTELLYEGRPRAHRQAYEASGNSVRPLLSTPAAVSTPGTNAGRWRCFEATHTARIGQPRTALFSGGRAEGFGLSLLWASR
jgi:hypothetical protein